MSAVKTQTDPISYYLRHPMHCGVLQFLHWEGVGIVECTLYQKGLENPPQPYLTIQFGKKALNFRPDDALPLATARRLWGRFIGEGWEFRQEDRGGVRMVGWRTLKGAV